MRAEDRSFSYPDDREDCDRLEDCSKCGLLADYLLENKPFTCYCPKKSYTKLGCLM